MNEQWAHDKSLTDLGGACDFGCSAADSQYVLIWQEAVSMRARNDLERPILGATSFEMYPHCDQLPKKLSGRLDKERAFLAGPTFKFCSFDALGDGNAEILVSRNRPVSECRFLEVGALDGYVAAWDNRRKPGVPPQAVNERRAPWFGEKVSGSA